MCSAIAMLAVAPEVAKVRPAGEHATVDGVLVVRTGHG
jgi:hypothetical protein